MRAAKDKLNETEIEAFRLAKDEAENLLFVAGLDAGFAFVRPQTYLQMRRLSRWRKEAGHEVDILVSREGVLGISAIMAPDTYLEFEAELRTVHGDDVEEPSWLFGFVEGAVQRFSDIESRL